MFRNTNFDGIEVLLFDMDGVLVDSTDTIYSSFIEALNVTSERHDIDVIVPNRQELFREFGQHIIVIFSKFIDKKLDDVITEYCVKRYHEIYPKNIKLTKLREEVYKSLSILSGKYSLSVVTNTPTELTTDILEELGILHFFSEVVGGDPSIVPKPEPDMIFKAIKKLDSNPDKGMMLGDTIYDMMAASKAGVIPIGIYSGVSSRKELQKNGGVFVLDNLNELLKHLKVI